MSQRRTNYIGPTGKDEDREDRRFKLCPPRVLGYVIREKQWAQLDIKSLKPIPKEVNEEEILSILHLAGEKGDKTKNLLIGLVKTHGDNAVIS